MTWLNAALAFAITMLILSMSTSVIVETIHRAFGLREQGLRILLERFYEKVIAPYLEQTGNAAPATKAAFTDLMTAVRPAALGGGASSLGTLPIIRLLAGDRLARLNVNDFMSRLGNSEFGDAVSSVLGESDTPDPEQALKSIAEEFDAFGREVSSYFERRARLTSVIVAIVIALVLYVQPKEIFTTYLNTPQAAADMIKMRDEVKARYEKSVSQQTSPSADAEPTKDDLHQSLDDANAALTATLSSLKDSGTPIGWTTAKWNALHDSDPDKTKQSLNMWSVLTTFLWLIVGGFLVGLGGPFWYDMVNSLSSILTLVTGAKKMADTLNLTPPATVAAAPSESPQPQTPVEHFKAAAAGRLATSPLAPADDVQPVG